MKSFNKLFALAIVALMTVAGSNAFAASVILDSFILPSGGKELRIKYTNFDMGVVYGNDTTGTTASGEAAVDSWATGQTGATGAVGDEDTWGIFKVSDLLLDDVSATSPVWQDGDGGVELVGMFFGLTDIFVEQTDTTEHLIQSAGGTFILFEQAAGTFNELLGSGGRTALDMYTTVTDGGNRVLKFDTAAGHLDLASDNGGIDAEFEVTFNNGNTEGDGTTYGHVDRSDTDDEWADFLDTNAFGNAIQAANGVNPADLLVQFDTFPYNDNQTVETDDWLVTSDDPVRGRIIPLPGAASMGFGLMGLLAVARKRRNG